MTISSLLSHACDKNECVSECATCHKPFISRRTVKCPEWTTECDVCNGKSECRKEVSKRYHKRHYAAFKERKKRQRREAQPYEMDSAEAK